MGKTATNIAVVLGLITVAAAGYYLYTQQGAITFSGGENQFAVQNMLSNTEVFIDRRRKLDAVEMKIEFFEDDRFLSLKNYRTPIEERPVGRPNPFAETSASLQSLQSQPVEN